jgi:hypothetical protein
MLVALAVAGASLPAAAQPYRLRGDALAAARSPTGLIVLAGEARPVSWVATEAVLWTGAVTNDDELDAAGDALVAVVRLRDPEGQGDFTAGRFVLATGAVRPVHLDGGHARGKLPWGIGLEVFGGLPVVPALGSRAYDWVVGGRVSESYLQLLTAGVSYVQRRDRGRLDDEEVGFDAAFAPSRLVDIAGRAAYDVVSPGLTEAHVSVATRPHPYRFEAFAMRRSPARMLPASSIFSALGDIPSDQLGLYGTWFAAPRLEVRAGALARWAGDELGAEGTVRARLRLDERGEGLVEGQARRTTVVAPWTGLGLALRVPLVHGLRVATEIELAMPDEAQGRGQIWPWALVALGWRFDERWDASLALEAGSTPADVRTLDAIFRLGTVWEGP